MSSPSSSNQTLPRSGGGRAVTLAPGIYVAARSLQMSGPASLGAHQFVIGIPLGICTANTQNLSGHEVVVIGAYNQSGRLQPALNAASDAGALRNYLSGSGSLDIARVNYSAINSGISSLINGYQKYVAYERTHPISYPSSGGVTITGCDTSTTYNSNSWAQSLVIHRLGPGLVRRDFAGIDICHGNTIPLAYFR